MKVLTLQSHNLISPCINKDMLEGYMSATYLHIPFLPRTYCTVRTNYHPEANDDATDDGVAHN